MLRDEILRAETLGHRLRCEPDIELVAQVLTSTSFRFTPGDLAAQRTDAAIDSYVDSLNHRLATELGRLPGLIVCHHRVGGRIAIRIELANLGTARDDLTSVPRLVTCIGQRLDSGRRCRLHAVDQAVDRSSRCRTRFAATTSGRS